MSDNNPYAPPAAALSADDKVPPHDAIQASKWRRFFTFLLDYVFIFLGVVVLAIADGFFGIGIFTEEMNFWREQLTGILIYSSYYLFFEALFARTPAKWILGTLTVDLEGGKPSFKLILWRSLSRLIPFEQFSYLGSQPNGWHDRISDTRVVSLSKLRAFREGTLSPDAAVSQPNA